MTRLEQLHTLLVNSLNNYVPKHFESYELLENQVTMRRAFPAEDITFQLNSDHNYLTCIRKTWDNLEITGVVPTISMFDKIIVPDLIILINHMIVLQPSVSTVFTLQKGVIKGVASDDTTVPPRKASDDTVMAYPIQQSPAHLQVCGLRRLSSSVIAWFLRVVFCYDPSRY